MDTTILFALQQAASPHRTLQTRNTESEKRKTFAANAENMRADHEVLRGRLAGELVIVLNGPRTVGKSTLLGQLAQRVHRHVIDCDDLATGGRLDVIALEQRHGGRARW